MAARPAGTQHNPLVGIPDTLLRKVTGRSLAGPACEMLGKNRIRYTAFALPGIAIA